MPEQVSWERAGGGGGGVPALAAVLQPAPNGSAGWCATGCSVLLERTKGGDAPSGWILEVVAWQPNFLGRASESAQEGDKPSVCRVRSGVP